MAKTPAELFVASFTTEDGAMNAFGAVASARKEQLLKVQELAVVRRDSGGKLHISEGNDMSAGGAAASGAAMGAAMGIFGGPIGLLVGGAAGAVIGGLAGKLIDTGIPDDQLKQIGERLTPGSSAFVAFVDQGGVPELRSAFEWAGGPTLVAAEAVGAQLSEAVSAELAAAKDQVTEAVTAAGGTVDTAAGSHKDATS